MNPEVRASIREIIDYNWAGAKLDFEYWSEDDQRDIPIPDHIWHDLKRVRAWLEENPEGHWCSGPPEWDEDEQAWVCGYCENWTNPPEEKNDQDS
jgi:hypothetical protein